MHVHKDIAALRGNRAPQRQAQTAMKQACEAWKADTGAAAMIEELARFGVGAPLEACPQLETVFTAPCEAERLMALLSQCYCAALAANPLGHPPFRHSFDGRAASLLLARSGRAQLVIQTREPGKYSQPSYLFSDGLRYDAVLGGAAQAQLVRRVEEEEGQARFSRERLRLKRGCRLALDMSSETLEVDLVASRLVVLRLLRNALEPQPAREYDSSSGRFLQQSAGNLGISRQEATIALLGRMGRADAAPCLADIAQGAGDTSVRWQALRECLALETACGFAALCCIARRPGDDLASPAGALRAQLLETHPQLARLEAA